MNADPAARWATPSPVLIDSRSDSLSNELASTPYTIFRADPFSQILSYPAYIPICHWGVVSVGQPFRLLSRGPASVPDR